MLCDPKGSDNKEKGGDNLSCNNLINLKILSTKIEKILVCLKCAHDKDVQIKLKQQRD